MIFAAPFKAGKSTLVANLIRSLADGDPFLGRFAVRPVDGTIALVDFEMSSAQLDAWLRVQGIKHDDRVLVLPMRGHAASFNILDPGVRKVWAAHLRDHQVAYLSIDCLRPILDALGLDEHRDVGRFLVALDALLLEAGIRECVVIHHMGHVLERSRGDSRLRDWPDVEWRMVRQDDDDASPRFITAYGRDVNVPESRLLYEPATRALTIIDGSRKDSQAREALAAVLATLDAAEKPLSGQALKTALHDTYSKHVIDAALRLGVNTKVLTFTAGTKNAKLYQRAPVSVSQTSAGNRNSTRDDATPNSGSVSPVSPGKRARAKRPRNANVSGEATPGSVSVSPVSPSFPSASGNSEVLSSVCFPTPIEGGKHERSVEAGNHEHSLPSKRHLKKQSKRGAERSSASAPRRPAGASEENAKSRPRRRKTTEPAS